MMLRGLIFSLLLVCLKLGSVDSAAQIVASQSSGSYPTVEFYKIVNSENTLGIEDAHCVHGTQTADGGYVCTGKYMDSGKKKGFLAKVSSSGAFQWRTLLPGPAGQQSGGNCVAEAPASAGSYLLVAGFAHSSDGCDRTLVKFSSAGALVWMAQFADPTAGLFGGWEYLQFLSGGGVVLGGFVNGAAGMDLDFKSYGNVEGCTASLMVLPASAVDAASAPTAAAATVDITLANSITVKSVRQLSAGFVVATQKMNGDDQEPEVHKLDAAGSVTWTVSVATQGEVTDVAVSADETYFILSGHKNRDDGGFNTYDARFSKISATDGSTVWSVTHGITDKLIYDECWGLQFINDAAGEGVVAACGTGIEPGTCSKSELTSAEQSSCNSIGTGWKNLNIRLSTADGAVVWQRVDQYYPDETDPSYTPSSSASEYLAFTSDGGIVVITDEAEGIGFMKFAGSPSPTPSPTPAPNGPTPAPNGPTPAPNNPTPAPGSLPAGISSSSVVACAPLPLLSLGVCLLGAASSALLEP